MGTEKPFDPDADNALQGPLPPPTTEDTVSPVTFRTVAGLTARTDQLEQAVTDHTRHLQVLTIAILCVGIACIGLAFTVRGAGVGSYDIGGEL